MPDDKTKKGGRDRKNVAGNEDYEVQYESKKTGSKPAAVKKAVKSAGNSREKVEKNLKKK